ncbi:hypothetical protein E2C01_010310 [Portunus trituberculatus]|uniref:Uncharacterized protein n=1 Tax=Portunus trituberculatus TaxID=210409 RepID=A0A5B7D8A0_PORTR|nr:hypothetical protein [Portunus trituberculatus]
MKWLPAAFKEGVEGMTPKGRGKFGVVLNKEVCSSGVILISVLWSSTGLVGEVPQPHLCLEGLWSEHASGDEFPLPELRKLR